MEEQMAQNEVTQLLYDWSRGDETALDKLMPLVETELRRLAHRYMSRERRDHTLQTTALVNEAYIRLVDHSDKQEWQNRAHFFAVAARVMRHILVDYARSHQREKRGGELQRIELEDVALMTEERADELVALDDALKELTQLDERKSKVVELRYFGGLSLEETAEVMKISEMTVRRDWRWAKTWLYRALKQ